MEPCDYIFKLVIVGNSGVGKSCVILRYSDDLFDFSHISTIGVDFRIRTIKRDTKCIKLEMWDTAGQDRFMSITQSYYRGAHGIFIVYDVTNRDSFNDVQKWYNQIKTHAREDVQIVMIGNKCDLHAKRSVTYNAGMEMAKKLGISFLETSAKDSQNINDAFETMVTNILTQSTSLEPAKPKKELKMLQTDVVQVKEPPAKSCAIL